ncbi:MAG TPA: DUF120 domain-containing protein [Chloroflexota bacterium]|nr:DUF120 domain-containing protein [Chloroflexota bacterium]
MPPRPRSTRPARRSRSSPKPGAIEVRGRLVRGLGEAAGFTQLPWVLQQCREKLGFEPYPGTVNLKVLPADMPAWQELQRQPGAILSPPDQAFCDAVCHLVLIQGQVRGATIVPHVAGYPTDKLELLAPEPIVAALGLAIEQQVSVRLIER